MQHKLQQARERSRKRYAVVKAKKATSGNFILPRVLTPEMLELLRPAIEQLAGKPGNCLAMPNLRQVLVNEHGAAGRKLAKKLEHKTNSKIYRSVSMLINSVSANGWRLCLGFEEAA